LRSTLFYIYASTADITTKILIFNQPNVAALQDSILETDNILIWRTSSKGDIRLYFTTRPEPVFRRCKIPSSSDWATIAEHLVRACNDIFMWAQLTIKYLSSPALTPSERLDTIWKIQLPEGLDVMYERIFCLWERSYKPEKNVARRIFLWFVYVRETLTIDQLHNVFSTAADVFAKPGVSTEYESGII
jgi:hypothetical protein